MINQILNAVQFLFFLLPTFVFKLYQCDARVEKSRQKGEMPKEDLYKLWKRAQSLSVSCEAK